MGGGRSHRRASERKQLSVKSSACRPANTRSLRRRRMPHVRNNSLTQTAGGTPISRSMAAAGGLVEGIGHRLANRDLSGETGGRVRDKGGGGGKEI